ncbi:hypothetical protein [Paraburkholderia adhaesiva]|uniref:hypothetical protein n=1 Tax=Paraburkholderia adhaesiva TaxID=2883244 RepID=UPI001F1734BF|nr:hypothetical protein [Paraburkholderia adhaesiva]
MITFESDERTRGEQLVLRAMLEERPLARCDWHALRPCDFAHDLHGRIFRHAAGLMADGITPWAYAVWCSMRSERGMPAMQGVGDYLEWLTTDAPCFTVRRAEALVAFLDALADQWAAEARAEAPAKATRGRK